MEEINAYAGFVYLLFKLGLCSHVGRSYANTALINKRRINMPFVGNRWTPL